MYCGGAQLQTCGAQVRDSTYSEVGTFQTELQEVTAELQQTTSELLTEKMAHSRAAAEAQQLRKYACVCGEVSMVGPPSRFTMWRDISLPTGSWTSWLRRRAPWKRASNRPKRLRSA